MSIYKFNELDLHSWKNTKEKIQAYAQLLSDIKSKFTPHQKNYEEYCLTAYAQGLTTSTIPVIANQQIESLDLNLNFAEHKLKIFLGNKHENIDFEDQTIKSFAEEVEKILNKLGIEYKVPANKFSDESNKEYDKSKVEKYWNSLKQIYFVFLKFKASLLEETSNINFWPHHFDLAMLLFNGKIIEGMDPTDWSNSREQMNFGFSAGDGGIPEPYFYVTAYPFDKNNIDKALPAGAYWQNEGWNGAVLKYSSIAGFEKTDEILLNFFNPVKEIVLG